MVECPLQAKVEAEPEPEPASPGTMDEGAIDINGYKISGIRTYSIILLIILFYGFLAITQKDLQGMQNLALMAAGFLFGSKVVSKR